MLDAGRHPNIELLVNSEVEDVTGFVGNFRARVRRKPMYVDPKACNSCSECAKVCPVTVPDEYQQGFSSRAAIYLPFPQAVPAAYFLRAEDCLGSNPIACGKCLEVCEKKCIDFDAEEKIIDLEVGTILLATGMEVYDPRQNDEYGYTRFENVITSMEFERLICAGGPTGGHFIRPSDHKVPERIGFVQCVGSRSVDRGMPYCSNICCLNTVKETLLLSEHYPDSHSTVFYTDMRAFGKGFEDLYTRSRNAGVRYLRGLPGVVNEDEETGDLIVQAEDTISGRVEEHRFDMLVLAVGMVPHSLSDNGGGAVERVLNLSHTSDGFVMEAHPKLRPVDAPTRGIFFAGCVEAPKDIKESVTQASAAAARAGNLLSAGQVRVEAITASLILEACNQCGLCAKVCPYHAISPASKKEDVYPVIVEAACSGCGTCAAECPQDAIWMNHFSDPQIMAQVDAILEGDCMEKVLAFACNWCSYAGADTAGTSRMQYPASVRLIRTMCSGRVDEKFIWHAFEKGAAIVLVSGCHFTDCHYINAVTWTQKRVEKVWTKMEKLDIRPERLQLEWISAAEGQKFARVMGELDALLPKVTEAEVEETVRILESEKDKEKAKREAKERKKASVETPTA